MKDHEIRELFNKFLEELEVLSISCENAGIGLNFGRVRTILNATFKQHLSRKPDPGIISYLSDQIELESKNLHSGKLYESEIHECMGKLEVLREIKNHVELNQ